MSRPTYSPSDGSSSSTASPRCPMRAVRPTRCTYSLGSPGGSYCTMVVTAGKSRPRAATSVHNSTPEEACGRNNGRLHLSDGTVVCLRR